MRPQTTWSQGRSCDATIATQMKENFGAPLLVKMSATSFSVHNADVFCTLDGLLINRILNIENQHKNVALSKAHHPYCDECMRQAVVGADVCILRYCVCICYTVVPG